MVSSYQNPLGLDGFAFCEFTSPDPVPMAKQLLGLGFVAAARRDGATLFRQGRTAFVINSQESGHAAEFRRLHGPSACGMGFRVEDASEAYRTILSRGAKGVAAADTLFPGAFAVEGIGGSLLYLVEGDPFAYWEEYDGWREAAATQGCGLDVIDHLTHNVRRGQMRVWSDFYARLFGFEEQKFFDIKGRATGLFSQAMIAPDGATRIPLNESQDDESQIEEFIRDYNGEGIQHIALSTDDIHATVEKLRANGIRLQDTVETYYELVDTRVPGHGEDLARLKANRILIDGDVEGEGILLQIFTETMFGPIFFEIIQRKGNEGFGNGNFQALYESIELDQIRRGVVSVDA